MLAENWPAWELFRRLDTQWHEGRLDYGALWAVMRMTGVPKAKRARRLDQVRLIERGAREVIGKRRRDQRQRIERKRMRR